MKKKKKNHEKKGKLQLPQIQILNRGRNGIQKSKYNLI